MTFISYAQNFEDVILWRALKHIENGFYVDIGAQDPNIDSVSKGFYERGWRGVHVEPTPIYARKLRDARRDEDVIEAAIGVSDDSISFYEIPETGLSTGDLSIAEIHRNSNLPVLERRVEQMRLSTLFDQIGARAIHWLKVDVEGMEKAVIDSWYPSASRPWVVVVESTKPRSSEISFGEWEPTLLKLGYEFAYFDGLNRFYVHSSQQNIKASFGPGPNVFDDFVLFGSSNPTTALFEERLRQRNAELAIRSQASKLEAQRSPGQPSRILLDLSTSLAWRGKHAVGIVRTEREIAVRLLNDSTIDVVPVVFHQGSLRALDPALALELVSTAAAPAPCPALTAEAARKTERQSSRATFRSLHSVQQRLLRVTFATMARAAKAAAKYVIRNVPPAARSELRQSLIFGRQAIRNILYKPNPYKPHANGAKNPALDLSLIVHPNKNDVLFIGGLGWDVVDCAALSSIKARSRLKVANIVYDLIPTKHPELLGGQPSDYYLNYFLHMVDLADHSFCISKCTRNDFIAFCANEGRIPPETSVLYLGADVPVKANAAEINDPHLVDRLEKGRYALSVGTFEIRKNYKLLLSIWPELIKDASFELDLVLVGMPGWRVDDIISEMERSPLFNKRVFWLQRMSDAGLSWLYDNCHVFLFPSLYEGWGLPVVEALQHGRPAIISSRGSTPEAGMGLATVIDPDNREEWKRQIRRYSVMERSTNSGEVKLPSWNDSAGAVKERLLLFNRDYGQK